MHLLLISGFLGSGKTTLVISLARAAAGRGRRAAVLVNEIGEIGIDGQLMRQLDLNVWEMYNGCICCVLSADLVPALEALDRDYDVDLVLLEPSGVAEPKNILQSLAYYQGRPLESITSVAVVDPLRIAEIYEVLTPLISAQMAHARLLLINKADTATEEQMAAARRIAAEVNAQAPLLAITARDDLPPAVLKELLPWI